jgi:hypothetical protein
MMMGQATQSRIITPPPAVVTEVVEELAKAPPEDLKKLVNIAKDFQKHRIPIEQLGQRVEETPYRSFGSVLIKYRADIYMIISIIFAALTYFHPTMVTATPKQIEHIIERVIHDLEKQQHSIAPPTTTQKPSPTKTSPPKPKGHK